MSRMSRLPLLLTLLLLPMANAHAQNLSLVTGIVRADDGTLLQHARVEARNGARLDTIVRTNTRGQYNVPLPFGAVHLRVTMIGYKPIDRDVTLNQPETHVDIVMTVVPHQLAERDVTAQWIGITGVVGDSSTMQPMPGVEVSSFHRGKKVVTDSLGRFEMALPKFEPTILQLEHDGFLTRPVQVNLVEGKPADLVLFMVRGHDPKYMKSALRDLSDRSAWGGQRSAILSREELARYGAKSVSDALSASGIAARKQLPAKLDNACVFVDGAPSQTTPFWSINVADIDFIEIYAVDADETRTLAARWPGGQCNKSMSISGRSRQSRGGGPFVAVWMRK